MISVSVRLVPIRAHGECIDGWSRSCDYGPGTGLCNSVDSCNETWDSEVLAKRFVSAEAEVKKVSPRIFLHFAPCLAEFTKDEEQKRAKLLK